MFLPHKESWLSVDSGGERSAPHMAEQTLTDVKTEGELQCLLWRKRQTKRIVQVIEVNSPSVQVEY